MSTSDPALPTVFVLAGALAVPAQAVGLCLVLTFRGVASEAGADIAREEHIVPSDPGISRFIRRSRSGRMTGAWLSSSP